MRTRCARVVFVHLILAVGIVRSLSHPAVVNDIVMQLLSGAAVPQKRIHCETCRSCGGHLRRACNFTDGVQVHHKSHVRHEIKAHHQKLITMATETSVTIMAITARCAGRATAAGCSTGRTQIVASRRWRHPSCLTLILRLTSSIDACGQGAVRPRPPLHKPRAWHVAGCFLIPPPRPEAPTGLCNVVVAAARPAARHWLNYRADGWAPSPPHTARVVGQVAATHHAGAPA